MKTFEQWLETTAGRQDLMPALGNLNKLWLGSRKDLAAHHRDIRKDIGGVAHRKLVNRIWEPPPDYDNLTDAEREAARLKHYGDPIQPHLDQWNKPAYKNRPLPKPGNGFL